MNRRLWMFYCLISVGIAVTTAVGSHFGEWDLIPGLATGLLLISTIHAAYRQGVIDATALAVKQLRDLQGDLVLIERDR